MSKKILKLIIFVEIIFLIFTIEYKLRLTHKCEIYVQNRELRKEKEMDERFVREYFKDFDKSISVDNYEDVIFKLHFLKKILSGSKISDLEQNQILSFYITDILKAFGYE